MPQRAFRDPGHERAIRDDGYLVLDLLDDHEVDHLVGCFAAVDADHTGDFTATALIDNLDCRRRVYDDVGEVLRRRVLPVLDDYRIVIANFVAKRPQSEMSTVAVHQDFTFFEDDEQPALTLWSPLVATDAENGWLGLLPGSHRFNPYYRAPGGLPYHDLSDLIEQRYLKFLPMRPGEVLLMDTRTFHGSPPNRTARLRPVAGGVAIPRESQLLYCHRDYVGEERVVEVYEVPEDFYLRHDIGTRPREGRLLKTVPRRIGELTEAKLIEHWETVCAHG
jgi:hypothetical protein